MVDLITCPSKEGHPRDVLMPYLYSLIRPCSILEIERRGTLNDGDGEFIELPFIRISSRFVALPMCRY